MNWSSSTVFLSSILNRFLFADVCCYHKQSKEFWKVTPFNIKDPRYIALFVVRESMKKLLLIDCVNIQFFQSIDNYVFSMLFQWIEKCRVAHITYIMIH